MKKVLFVATVDIHINTFHLPYLHYFKEQGYEVHVATGDVGDIAYCDKKHTIPITRSPYRVSHIKAIKQLEQIIQQEMIDVIHCHTPMGSVVARLAARKARVKLGTKVLYTAHGFHFYKGAPLLNWLVYYPIEKWLGKYTDCLITINEEDYQLATKKIKAKRVEYVPGVGIDVEKFDTIQVNKYEKRKALGVPEDAILLVSVGEMSKRKNHKVVIQALAKLKNKNIYYILCGKGNQQVYLTRLCNMLGIRSYVIFLGFRTDIGEICSVSDIFILPSLQEGLPVAIMENMAIGLPCIVSKVRGNVDLIDDLKGGYSYPKNKSELLGEAIEKLSRDKDLRIQMGAYNKQKIKRFDIKHTIVQMSEIYKRECKGDE